METGGVAFLVTWHRGVDFFKNALYRSRDWAEEFLHADLNNDGHIGQEPVERYIPVNADGGNERAMVLVPPMQPGRGNELVQLANNRNIRKRRLVEFLTTCFGTGDWTRDKSQERGYGQKEWADIKAFLEPFGVWKTEDRSTLLAFLEQLGYTGNERTETNGTNE